MPGKCVSYHARQLFNVDAHNVAIGVDVKISRSRLTEIIKEELYMRAVMFHEIRYMGDDRLAEVHSENVLLKNVSYACVSFEHCVKPA